MKLVIVTGMSGAGKTVAIQSFEDLGYFTIDNIPPTLVPKFLQLLETTNDIDKLALVVDMRSRSFFAEIQYPHSRQVEKQVSGCLILRYFQLCFLPV